ncbi:MAG: hypothetical protein M3R03_00560 [Pseudomonadota bacterium]|nr:hypothetical protein [Pseudomonadota bacterium]
MRLSLLMLVMVTAPLMAQDAPAGFEAARFMPLAPGQWSYAPMPGGSEARFGGTFVIQCDRNTRRVTLRRPELAMTAPATAMIVTTDLAVHTVPADGILANSNRVLDAIAFSRGRFIVSGGGSASQLVAPSSPEAARTIEDCRN